MKSEATLLKQNPLLINKIIAERLSDKLQIMMVPSDAKVFFNDVLKGGISPNAMSDARATQGAMEDDQSAEADTQESQWQNNQQFQNTQQPQGTQFQNNGRKNWKSR
jgi:hypothetical protein